MDPLAVPRRVDGQGHVPPIEQYQDANSLYGSWQVVSTVVPFAALMLAMFLALDYSYALTLALAVPAALCFIRLFVLFHDCTHRSLFRSTLANEYMGTILGLLTLTPYHHWRTGHGIHHGCSGNLDRRSGSDIWTLTVAEYRSLPLLKRIVYRIYRSPITLLVFGPPYKWIVHDRMAILRGKKQRFSVHLTNFWLLFVLAAAAQTVGLGSFLSVVIPPAFLATSAGIALFYIQHTFEGAYWQRADEWDFEASGLMGSSFLMLPPILRWFTANIGYHHVHHLDPRIPNHRLKVCHDHNGPWEGVHVLSLKDVIGCFKLKLWDEQAQTMVTWRGAAR